MPYANRQTQNLAQRRSDKRLAGVRVREAAPPVQINSPRQALRLIADAVNRVRADETIDQLTVSRLQLEASKIAHMIFSSQLDAKLDALAAEVAALTHGPEGTTAGKLPPLALPPGDAVDATFTESAPSRNKGGRPRKDGNPPGWRAEPLGGVNPGAPAHPNDLATPPRNKGGRPRKDGMPPGWRPTIAAVPNAEQFNTALEQFVANAADDDD